ncbi:MAG: lytic transglycosylase domain-containing protein [Geminicoccaceae bacterium]|nr:lytic transglycosylase domain-containing protein [Geminicoccaceae bacterium]
MTGSAAAGTVERMPAIRRAGFLRTVLLATALLTAPGIGADGLPAGAMAQSAGAQSLEERPARAVWAGTGEARSKETGTGEAPSGETGSGEATSGEATSGEAASGKNVKVARLNPDADIPTRLGPLPQPLGAADIARYEKIFDLQEDGHWRDADHVIRQLDNDVLMGHVLAQRYLHPTAYRSKYAELADWLDAYADLPQAASIYRLAVSRHTPGVPEPKKPVAGFLGGSGQELLEERKTEYVSGTKRSRLQTSVVQSWLETIGELVSKDRPTQATGLLRHADSRAADTVEQDIARWTIAKGYFANRMDRKALDYAAPAARRSGRIEPRMHWTAGLAAWRLGEIGKAFEHFSTMAQASVPGEEAASAAFWAARAALALRKPELHRVFLEQAAAASDEFYGLLARGLLGLPIAFDWHESGLNPDMRNTLTSFPGAVRAIALGQVNRPGLAEKEIRKLAARARPKLTEALAALAESLRLPAAQMRVAQRLRLQDGRRHDGAMYPLPAWQPENGYRIDRAVLFSLMRAESGFDPAAKSSAGALGIMQVLPSTAKVVARRTDVDYAGADTLGDPVTNMTIGQAYVERLLDNGIINGSLIHTVVAYNAGLKRLDDWVDRFSDLNNDPLLFLESVPIPETRLYAKKVMANIWAYRVRLEQPPASLEQLAWNQWPIYSSFDTELRYARSH